MATFVVGISGGSGSGKTTLARGVLKALGSQRATLLYQDSYYVDQSARFKEDGGSVNFDHPDSLEFSLLARHLADLKADRAIESPTYDFVTHKRRVETTPLSPHDVVIVDGTLLLSQAVVRPLLDLAVFVEAPESIRFERRKHRDTTERGRSVEGVTKQFMNHVKPMHDLFVEPSRTHATLVVSGERPIDECVRAVLGRIPA